MGKTRRIMERREERLILDPGKVFGDETTYSAKAVSAMLGLGLRQMASPDWINSLRVENSKEMGALPETLPVGTRILLFRETGRIDHFEVIQPKIVRCYLRRDKAEDFRYLPQRIGAAAMWKGIDRKSDILIGMWSSKITRIVVLYPKTD